MTKEQKKEQEAYVVALRSLGGQLGPLDVGMSSDPLIIKCRDTAKDFATRIMQAKTEEEADAVRAEFNKWSKEDVTFSRILLGIKSLL